MGFRSLPRLPGLATCDGARVSEVRRLVSRRGDPGDKGD